MALDSSQRRIADLLLAEAARAGATARPVKALLEAGIVESGLRDLAGGDRDSIGVLQQRPSQGWKNAGDPTLAARDFLRQAIALNRTFKGSAGQLAQAVQRSAFPGRYDEHAGEAEQLLRGSGSASSEGANSEQAQQQPWDTSAAGVDLAALLSSMQGPRAAAPSVGVQAPAFSAQPTLPAGYQAPMSGGVAAQPSGTTEAALQAILASGGQNPAATSSEQPASGQTGSQASPARGGRSYPLGRRAQLIGKPYTGTHTLGNWQSDNAVDLAVPMGTPVRAVEAGVIEKVKGGWHGGRDRFDGYQVTVRLADGRQVFYTHLRSVRGLQAGDEVRAGQTLGGSGAANGVAHLHFAVDRGDPRKLIGQGR